jgi:hypothetical protein
MNPAAPAPSAAATVSSSSNVVRIRTGGDPARERSWLVALAPSMRRIRTSITTTSGQ